MTWLIKNIKNIGLVTLFGMLVTAITWVVNLNRDISDLKDTIVELKTSKIDEARAIFIFKLESADQKNAIKDLQNYLLDHH